MSGKTEPVPAKPMSYRSRGTGVSIGGLPGRHHSPHPSSDIEIRDTVDQINNRTWPEDKAETFLEAAIGAIRSGSDR